MGGRTENQTLSSVIWSYDLTDNGKFSHKGQLCRAKGV